MLKWEVYRTHECKYMYSVICMAWQITGYITLHFSLEGQISLQERKHFYTNEWQITSQPLNKLAMHLSYIPW